MPAEPADPAGGDEPSSASSEPVPNTPGLSRRDFLRRASKEAAETGTRLVPGASLARAALGIGEEEPVESSDGGDDSENKPRTRVPRWLRPLLNRRAGNPANPSTGESDSDNGR